MRIKPNWNYLPTPLKEKFTANLGKDLPEVRLSIEELNRSIIKLTPFTSHEKAWKIIKNVPSTKVPGCDNIPNSPLKHIPDPTVAFPFSKTLENCYIIIIQKPHKDHSLSNNYRPISLLITISKVFEKVLQNLLKKYIKPKSEQHAFKYGHATIT
ncbi:hypothetical protein QTP88_008482 [Uroleucon formosanum]